MRQDPGLDGAIGRTKLFLETLGPNRAFDRFNCQIRCSARFGWVTSVSRIPDVNNDSPRGVVGVKWFDARIIDAYQGHPSDPKWSSGIGKLDWAVRKRARNGADHEQCPRCDSRSRQLTHVGYTRV